MGKYLNPGNNKFRNHVKSRYYVDKSSLIAYVNNCAENDDARYFCFTRPSRFGKSYAADMLVAYFSRGCESHALFEKFDIADDPAFDTHLNKHDVIYFDVAQIIKTDVDAKTGIKELTAEIVEQIEEQYPDVVFKKKDPISMFEKIYDETGIGLVFIIDEWDCPFRERKNDKTSQDLYLQFLKDLLKNREYVYLAYMTGILPIKKYPTGSALNMFDEYTMLEPGTEKEYIGFTEKEVGKLCVGSKFTEKDIKDWYDGYNLDGLEIYNPNSVVKALRLRNLVSYWTVTGAFEDLLSYINVNVEGLHDIILKLLAKERYVLPSYESFKNDLVSLENKNDYLVALIHLGYLSYNSEDGTIKIPNHEIRIQFVDSLGSMKESIVAKFYDYSNKLLDATTGADAKGIAEMLGRIFAELTKRTAYPYENSFSDFVDFAYMCANDYYDVIPEAPTRWLKKADFVLYPNLLRARKDRTYLPGIIIELKNEKSAKVAADQIEEKGYDDYFEHRGYHGDVIHVGLDFKKMTLTEKKALAEKCADTEDVEDGKNVGNDAGLDTMAEIVHFCELRTYRI